MARVRRTGSRQSVGARTAAVGGQHDAQPAQGEQRHAGVDLRHQHRGQVQDAAAHLRIAGLLPQQQGPERCGLPVLVAEIVGRVAQGLVIADGDELRAPVPERGAHLPQGVIGQGVQDEAALLVLQPHPGVVVGAVEDCPWPDRRTTGFPPCRPAGRCRTAHRVSVSPRPKGLGAQAWRRYSRPGPSASTRAVRNGGRPSSSPVRSLIATA